MQESTLLERWTQHNQLDINLTRSLMNDADERQNAQCRRVSVRDIIDFAPKNGENTGFYSCSLDTARWHIIDFPPEAASAASVFCRIIDFISYIL